MGLKSYKFLIKISQKKFKYMLFKFSVKIKVCQIPKVTITDDLSQNWLASYDESVIRLPCHGSQIAIRDNSIETLD